jgi:hypothetical protein
MLLASMQLKKQQGINKHACTSWVIENTNGPLPQSARVRSCTVSFN